MALAVLPLAPGTAAEPPAAAVYTNAAALLQSLSESNPPDIVRGTVQAPASIRLIQFSVTDRNLALLAAIPTLEELRIISDSNGGFSSNGIIALREARNLRSLTLQCFTQLPPGVLAASASLPQLRSLELNPAPPPDPREFNSLTNAASLESLRISGGKHVFGGAQLSLLTNLPNLKKLLITGTEVREVECRVLFDLPRLTNGLIWNQRWTVRLTREAEEAQGPSANTNRPADTQPRTP